MEKYLILLNVILDEYMRSLEEKNQRLRKEIATLRAKPSMATKRSRHTTDFMSMEDRQKRAQVKVKSISY